MGFEIIAVPGGNFAIFNHDKAVFARTDHTVMSIESYLMVDHCLPEESAHQMLNDARKDGSRLERAIERVIEVKGQEFLEEFYPQFS